MADLDRVLDPRPHDDFNRSLSDEELIQMYVSRRRRGKPTWQLEREIERRPGLMTRCLAAVKKLGVLIPEEPPIGPVSSFKFNADHPFERTVLVMMKFEGGSPEHDAKLGELFDVLSFELRDYGLEAVRADGKDYSDSGILWDNMVVYMQGCKYGIAVFDGLYSVEVNPSVALEVGAMLIMGKRVLLLKSESHGPIPTDTSGMLWKEFQFGSRPSVRKAIEAWMVDLGIRRIRS